MVSPLHPGHPSVGMPLVSSPRHLAAPIATSIMASRKLTRISHRTPGSDTGIPPAGQTVRLGLPAGGGSWLAEPPPYRRGCPPGCGREFRDIQVAGGKTQNGCQRGVALYRRGGPGYATGRTFTPNEEVEAAIKEVMRAGRQEMLFKPRGKTPWFARTLCAVTVDGEARGLSADRRIWKARRKNRSGRSR